MNLILSRGQKAAIRAHMRATQPEECCGLLLGDAQTGQVHEVRPTTNVAADRLHHFEIDPAALLAAYKAARSAGPVVLGHYHSHPLGTAQPSTVDAAMAEKRGEIWVIVDGTGKMTAWQGKVDGDLHRSFMRVALTIAGD
jgi:proteasome lid subunit RPN8/RPN11